MMSMRVVLLACVAFAATVSAQTDAAGDIRRLTADVNAAYARNDLEKYFSYYADDLTQWWPSGRVGLASYRDSWTKFVKSGGGIELAEVSDLQVQVDPSEDAAIATYLLRVRTRSATGKVSEEVNQETDVWTKRGGRWQIVHLHYSPAPKP
jgi:ketosteroid isomerase-like protein